MKTKVTAAHRRSLALLCGIAAAFLLSSCADAIIRGAYENRPLYYPHEEGYAGWKARQPRQEVVIVDHSRPRDYRGDWSRNNGPRPHVYTGAPWNTGFASHGRPRGESYPHGGHQSVPPGTHLKPAANNHENREHPGHDDSTTPHYRRAF